MIQSKSLGSKIFNVFNIILMSLLSLSCLYPLWYTLCLSVSDKAAANSGKVSFYPVGFSLASYQQNQVKDWESSAEDQADHIVDHAVIDHGDVPRNRSSVEQHTKNDDPHNHIFRMIFIR